MRLFTSIHISRIVWLVCGLFGWLVFFLGTSGFVGGLFGCLLVYAAVVFFFCILMWFFCMCVVDILLVDVGSCLQSGSQQSPDL